jgi:hypothetical protein
MAAARSAIDAYYMEPIGPDYIDKVDDQGLQNLRTAIVLDACKEFMVYVRLLKKPCSPDIYRMRLRNMQRVRDFFNSGWFAQLSGGIDPDKLMHVLQYETPLRWMTIEERKEFFKRQKEADRNGETESEGKEPGHDDQTGYERLAGRKGARKVPGGQRDREVADDSDGIEPASRKCGASVRTPDGRTGHGSLGSSGGIKAGTAGSDTGRQRTGGRYGDGSGDPASCFTAVVRGSRRKGEPGDEPGRAEV